MGSRDGSQQHMLIVHQGIKGSADKVAMHGTIGEIGSADSAQPKNRQGPLSSSTDGQVDDPKHDAKIEMGRKGKGKR